MNMLLLRFIIYTIAFTSASTYAELQAELNRASSSITTAKAPVASSHRSLVGAGYTATAAATAPVALRVTA
jgi:hypothetical protein